VGTVDSVDKVPKLFYFGLVLDVEYIPLSDYNSNGQHLGPEGALRPILNTSLSQKLCQLKRPSRHSPVQQPSSLLISTYMSIEAADENKLNIRLLKSENSMS
jgi:hypothetical protein